LGEEKKLKKLKPIFFLTRAAIYYTAVTTVYGLSTELNVSTTHNIGSLRADRLGTGAKTYARYARCLGSIKMSKFIRVR
jgi:hypothetical protein